MLNDVPLLRTRKAWMTKMELILSTRATLMRLTGEDATFLKL